ncbi:MAG: hypothetical protein ACSHX9_15925 [Luteolibacter sp.]
MGKEKSFPSTVKFSPELQKKIAIAAEKMELPKQEVIRLSAAIGLEKLRRINYDLAAAVVEKAKVSKEKMPHHE